MIQQVINEVLFKNKGDEGIKWAEYYDPFSSVAFALTLTVVSYELRLRSPTNIFLMIDQMCTRTNGLVAGENQLPSKKIATRGSMYSTRKH